MSTFLFSILWLLYLLNIAFCRYCLLAFMKSWSRKKLLMENMCLMQNNTLASVLFLGNYSNNKIIIKTNKNMHTCIISLLYSQMYETGRAGHKTEKCNWKRLCLLSLQCHLIAYSCSKTSNGVEFRITPLHLLWTTG